MASVCDTCQRKSCPGGPGVVGCTEWRNEYLARQKAINAYAQAVSLRRRLAAESPCESCKRSKTCVNPCESRLQDWDEKMKIIWRLLYGKTENTGDAETLRPQFQSENPKMESTEGNPEAISQTTAEQRED